MTTRLLPIARGLRTPFEPRWEHWWVTAVLSLVVTSAALVCAYGILMDQPKLVVLTIVGAAGVTLAVVASMRFLWFVLLLLVVRSSTDALKLGASDAGTNAANTVADRGPDPSSIIGIIFLLLGLLWLSAHVYEGRPLRPSILSTALLLFVVAGGLSVIGSDHVQASAIQLARLLSAVLMFVVLEQLITDRRILKRVLAACFAALVIPLCYTVVGLATGRSTEVKGDFMRVTGTFTQSNDYARFLAFFLLLGIAIFPHVGRRTKPWLAGLLVAAGCVLVLTLTLGAILAAFAGLVVLALMQRRPALLGLLGVSAAIALVAVPGLLGRISASTVSSELGGGATGNSLTWRLHFWASLLPINQDNPVTGVGLNATQYFTSSAKQPHSDFLSAYVETGVVGLLSYLALLTAMFVVTSRAVLRAQRGTFDRAVASGAMVCVGAFMVMSVAANVIQSTANFWYLLAITACASAVARFDEDGNATSTTPEDDSRDGSPGDDPDGPDDEPDDLIDDETDDEVESHEAEPRRELVTTSPNGVSTPSVLTP